MKGFMKKLLSILSSAAVAAAAFCMPITAFALDNNIYLADAHSHYRHPVTGVIEDSG